jgi:sugar lactone lactonase YvrE
MKHFKRLTHAAFIAATLLGAHGATAQIAGYGPPEVKFAWTRTMWDFRTVEERAAYLDAKIYAKSPLYGVDLDRNDNVYVTVARVLDNRVPASLNKLITKDGQTVLQPFPSWDANKLGDAAAFQSVLGLEVDARNRMWIVDMGFAGGYETMPAGTQKIVVWDLNTNKEIKRLVIADDIANPKTSFLNDIAVDGKNEIGYISDSGLRAGANSASGIIVYDFKSNKARRVLDKHVSTANDATRPLKVNGEDVFPGNPLQVGINGITLSPDGATLYWSITTGDAVYAIGTRYLRDASLTDEQLATHVQGPVRIGGGSDGLTTDSAGNVYVSNLAKNAIQVMHPKTMALSTLASDDTMIWPDSFSWDSKGGLWLSTNHLNHAFGGAMDFDKITPNFRLIRIQTPFKRGDVK